MDILERLAELHPRHPMIGGVHGQVVGPPRVRRTLKLMGNKKRLLVILALKESELLLDGAKPMVGVEWILSMREGRRLSPQEI